LLKPGGTLLVSCPYHGLAKDLLISLLWFDRHFAPDHPHIRFYTLRSLQRVLADHAFVLEAVHRLGWFWPVYRTLFVSARKCTASASRRGRRREGFVRKAVCGIVRLAGRWTQLRSQDASELVTQ